jgi:2-C-methyl-D-erythritol 4-phosphate cytidylyltransferase
LALALIVAAGRGERLGSSGPKALVPLAGRPLLLWSIELLLGLPEIDRVVVALPAGVPAPAGVIGVRGGDVRSQSVALALAGAGTGAGTRGGGSGDPRSGGPGGPSPITAGSEERGKPDSDSGVDPRELVLVHDAARPLASAELVRATLATLEGDERLDAAIAAAPVSDTIKRVDGEGVVVETLERSILWAVQTPQVFRREALERALDVPADILAQATDDAWLVERIGGRVAVVPADTSNLKITTPVDLELAEMLVARGEGGGIKSVSKRP